MKNLPLGHLKVSSGTIDDAIKFIYDCISSQSKAYCIPLNLTKYVLSKSDEKLKQVIREANMIISDGVPIVWLSKRAGYNRG